VASSLTLRAGLVSLALFGVVLAVWQFATSGPGPAVKMGLEYARLMGAAAREGRSAMPPPAEVGAKIWQHLKDPFYDRGTNDKGIGIQLAYSIARVGAGYLLASLVAIPIGFLLGMSPLMRRALDPFVQLLRPVSPLAWMPLALYTIKDSGISAIFVIFVCSLVIVAAEMLVGGTGIGYFVWNEWNNLSISNVITAILFIGIVGMALDQLMAKLQRTVAYAD
jgi:nitrate/nitrite transport system permease protein